MKKIHPFPLWHVLHAFTTKSTPRKFQRIEYAEPPPLQQLVVHQWLTNSLHKHISEFSSNDTMQKPVDLLRDMDVQALIEGDTEKFNI